MANVLPFKAIRPCRDKVHLVASRSYITYSTEELKEKLDGNPYTFLHILNPDYKAENKTEANTPERFKLIKHRFEDFVKEQIILQDDKPYYYIYRQIKNGHPYVGVIGTASIEDYENKVIKKHEATISRREEVFKKYLKTVEINAEPVCFTYENHKTIDKITQKKILERPEYDFTTTNKVRHSFWIIEDEKDIQKIQQAFHEIDALYIADGHHRSASSALLGNELKKNNPNHHGQEKYNFFMGIFVPESELQIFEFNRLVTDIGDLSKKDFLKAIEKSFEVIFANEDIFTPRKIHEIGMYIDRKWYCLIPKEGSFNDNDPVDSLDVSILTNALLDPILGIKDLRTDERIYFMGGLEDIETLKNDVDSGKARVAFTHFPVSMEQLKAVADADEIMPPKSTWIEPKLRSGLTVYSISEEEV